jgi:putative serine protease PepD
MTHRSSRYRFALPVVAALALAGIGVAVLAEREVQGERSSRKSAVESLQAQLAQTQRRVSILQARAAALQSANAALRKQVRTAQKSLATTRSLAPLASRILRSVFTVDTQTGFGTGWAAWRAGGATYVITANHVVQDAISRGTHDVMITRKGKSWPGVIVATDGVNDLAVVRVRNLRAPPLWQAPETRLPVAGDRVLLVGSPFGLEGTVTSGVVSRVRADEIIVDAAANPGNSGGPVVDSEGHVVGVLRSGVEETLSFLVPIERACVTARRCP